MDFKKFEIKDKEKIEKFTLRDFENNCEFTFYNLLIWQENYGNRYIIKDNNMFIRVGEKGRYIYALPFGDLKTGFAELRELSGEEYPDIWGQEGPQFEKFCKLYGEYYDIEEIRDEFDYIYLREDLQNLSGKKYHSKRNHISAFSKAHTWKYEEICESNLSEVKECAENWYKENSERQDSEMAAEKKGLAFLTDNMKALGITGGAIRSEGRIIAFTFGSAVNCETYDIYIEKALGNYSEAYTVINREFVSRLPQNIKYINREDDLGIDGLRKAKLSYHPYKLLKKYYCKKRDLLPLKKIYTEAFGESAEFDSLLFKNYSDCIETIKKDNNPVSMLFKIPCFIKGKRYYYIYAAATDKNERSKGYMTALLNRVKKQSDAPLFLVPSSENLIGFYEKNGFIKRTAKRENGEIKIEVSENQKQLSRLCDNCPDKFSVMFSENTEDKIYEFPYAMP